MGLNIIVHPFMNVSPSWKIVFSLVQIIREKYFHHLATNYYLHQEILHWNIALLFIRWNRSIYMIIILYVSCQVVWYSMTSSWIYSGTRKWNSTTKKKIIFYKDWENHLDVQGFTSILLLEESHIRMSGCSMCTFPYLNNRNEILFDQNIKRWHFKWLHESKAIPLVGFLS